MSDDIHPFFQQATSTKIHPFERAGHGSAPFRCVEITEKWYVACQGAPKQPGSSCDYCGNGIAYEFWIRSADGKKFKVGSECVRKTGDNSLIEPAEKMAAQLKLDLRHEKETIRIAAAQTRLETAELQGILASLPHPLEHLATQGLTRLDWTTWMLAHAGNKGKIDVAKFIESVDKGKLDIGTPERRKAEAEKLAARKVQVASDADAKKQAEAQRKAAVLAGNTWLVNALSPHARPGNFCDSIMAQLNNDQNPWRYQDLSDNVRRIIAEILAKEAGRKGSKEYDAAYIDISARLASENPELWNKVGF